MPNPFLKNIVIKTKEYRKVTLNITFGICLVASVPTSYAYPIFTNTFGSRGSGDGQFGFGLQGVAINPLNNNVYLADGQNDRIQIFDQNGVFVDKFGTYGSGPAQFDDLWGISVDTSGKVYTTDPGSGYISVFNMDNTFNNRFQFPNIDHDIKAILKPSTNQLYVLDFYHGFRVYNIAYDSGTHVTTYTLATTVASDNVESLGQNSSPYIESQDMSLDPLSGYTYIAVQGPNPHISVFDGSNTPLFTSPIVTPAALAANGETLQIAELSIDPFTKNIYTLASDSNYSFSEIDVYTPQGNLLSSTQNNVPGVGQLLGIGFTINPSTGKIYTPGPIANNYSDVLFTVNFDPVLWTQTGTSDLAILPLSQTLNLISGQHLQVYPMNDSFGNISSGITTLASGGDLTINTGSSFSTTGLTFDGGALNDNVNTTFTGPVSVTSNGGTIGSGANNMLTFTGVFSGSGNLTKTQVGSVVLAGNTSGFTGNLNIQEGNVTFANNATDVNYAGAISGAGSIVQAGSQTLTLSGVNNYTGTTSLQSGTLSIGAVNNIGTGNILFSGGTLTNTVPLTLTNNIIVSGSNNTIMNMSGNMLTLTGTLSGNGDLHKTGTGVLEISQNAQGFTGNTILTSGTLRFTNTDTLYYPSNISGNGAVEYAGTGSTILSGNNSFVGGTIISAGKVIMGGGTPFGVGSVQVHPNGALHGVGTIMGDLINNGIFSPGNSPGVVGVDNNYGGAGPFFVNIQPSANPQLNVDNSGVIINNIGDFTQTPLYVTSSEGIYTRSAKYKFVFTSSGTLKGPFPTPPHILHAGPYLLDIECDTNACYLVVSDTKTVTLPTNGTQQQNTIASTLNQVLAGTIEGPFGEMIGDLYDLPSEVLAASLDQISPMRNSYASLVSIENTMMFNRLITKHLEKYRNGTDVSSAGSLMSQVSFNSYKNTGQAGNSGNVPFANFFASQKKKAATTTQASALQESISNTLHVSDKDQKIHSWLSPYYYTSHMKKNPESNYGFKAKNMGLMGGVDYKLHPNMIIGGGLGYERNSVKYIYDTNNDDGGKNNKIRAALVSAYATLYSNTSYVDMTLLAGLDNYTLHRRIDYLNTTETTSKHKGYKITPHIGVGHTIKTPHVDITPFIGTDYAMLYEKGYTEKGGGVFDLKVKKKTSSWLQQEFGIRADKKVAYDEEHIIGLQAELRYLYKKPFNVQKVRANFIMQNAPFTLQGKNKSTHTIAPSVAVHFKKDRSDNAYISMGYDGEYSKSFRSHMAYASIGFKF